jgi:hypothetical protein
MAHELPAPAKQMAASCKRLGEYKRPNPSTRQYEVLVRGLLPAAAHCAGAGAGVQLQHTKGWVLSDSLQLYEFASLLQVVQLCLRQLLALNNLTQQRLRAVTDAVNL